ncbi:D-alanyl-D-alanine carboxypeptidase/D-alanyl-D-alanine endopeptidase [Streptomyces sp. NPDC054796]
MRDTASEVRNTAIRAYRAVRAYTLRSVRTARQRWRTASPRERQTAVVTAGSAVLGLVVAVVAVAATGPWDSGQRTAERAWAASQDRGSGAKHTGGAGDGRGPAPEDAPDVLGALGTDAADEPTRGPGSGNVPPPTSSALADALEPLLEDAALGPVRSASVVDAATGRKLYTVGAGVSATPASTVKLATAVAALSARGDGHRIETRAVRGGGGSVVLVGGGDPTLDADGIREIAKETARSLKKADKGGGAPEVSVGYDTSRYKGTTQHPISPNENIAAVTPLMVNEGRLDGSDHGPAPRSADPARDAAEDFAEALERQGVEVKGGPERAGAPARAKELGDHRSAPLSELVERMLTNSDNDIAEALARQTALAKGEEPSFAGAETAVRRELDKLGLPVQGARFADGSGLDRADKVSAGLLTQLLARAADPGRTELRSVLTGLPVAGFTGTLEERYGDEQNKPGAGLVRAKTGTLTGINTLAGTVVDADGRLLAFAFMTSGTKDAEGAKNALDRMASALANCGCRDSPSSG